MSGWTVLVAACGVALMPACAGAATAAWPDDRFADATGRASPAADTGIASTSQPAARGADRLVALAAEPAGSIATDGDGGASPASSGSSGKPAATTERPLSRRYLLVLWDDTRDTLTEPVRWDAHDWRNFGLVTGGLVLTGAFVDRPAEDAAQRGRTSGSDHFFKVVERFGTKQYGLPVLAGFYAYGAFADNENAKQVALDAFAADTVSALVSSSLKGIVGRARPNSGHGPGHFDPFHHDYSFPSGHATGAFAFASVIAAHYDSPWVDATAYGVAGLVGVARIRLNAHWTSDVIAGGLIGGLIGHHIVELNRRLREDGYRYAPTIGSDGNGLTLSWGF